MTVSANHRPRANQKRSESRVTVFDDVTVYDEVERCPYLETESARLPLQIPCKTTDGAETDRRLATGQRRTGEFVYFTQCPTCTACKPIRLVVDDFEPSRTHRRTLRRNDKLLTSYQGPVRVDAERVALFNKHRIGRQLGQDSQIDRDEYSWAFQRTCFDTFEMAYSCQGRVCCVAICDQGDRSLSAVYTYYDPDLDKMGLGTYSLLKQLEYCRRTGRRHLYLGFYIEASRHMAYKANFLPHERLLEGHWVRFDK